MNVMLSLVFGTFIALLNLPVWSSYDSACIGSLDDFAYSMPGVNGETQTVLYPNPPWELVARLPGDSSNHRYEAIATRTTPTGEEIWFRMSGRSAIYRENQPLLILNTETKTWEEIPTSVSEQVFVDPIVVGADGTVWGRNVWPFTASPAQPALSKFDENLRRFVPESATSAIPHGVSSEEIYPYWVEILPMTDGNLLILSPVGAIYKYEPQDEVVNLLTVIPKFRFINSYQLQGSQLFFETPGQGRFPFFGDPQILQFDVNANEVIQIDGPKGLWPGFARFLVDQAGRLWLDATGYRDPEGRWVLLSLRSVQLALRNYVSTYWLFYNPPQIFFESSDGRLWFRIYRHPDLRNVKTGMAWADPQTRESCWFTSEAGNLVEDSHHNLWLVIEGNVYAYYSE